jgi:ABC-type transporter Mla MlaB component
LTHNSRVLNAGAGRGVDARVGTAFAFSIGSSEEFVAMLRISNNAEGNTRTFRIEGTLSGAWVEELRRVCESGFASGVGLEIDCGGVSFVDAKGVALLRSLRESDVVLENCSPFLEWQLGQAAIASAERGER